jgi:hypothetical protein
VAIWSIAGCAAVLGALGIALGWRLLWLICFLLPLLGAARRHFGARGARRVVAIEFDGSGIWRLQATRGRRCLAQPAPESLCTRRWILLVLREPDGRRSLAFVDAATVPRRSFKALQIVLRRTTLRT